MLYAIRVTTCVRLIREEDVSHDPLTRDGPPSLRSLLISSLYAKYVLIRGEGTSL